MNAPLANLIDTALDRSVVVGYSRLGFAMRRRLWGEAPLPRLDGRVAAVTGATSGLGQATAAGLARLGARVLLVVRDIERGERVRSAISTQTGHEDLAVLHCDLADLGSVRACAAAVAGSERHLDVLVNNAGVLPDERRLSREGIELTFATNVVGPFLLTNLLVPALAESGRGRVINVSSGGMYAQRLQVGDLELESGPFDGVTAYARTKRAEVVLTELWAQRLHARGIVVHAMHPGWADTPGVESSLPRFHRLMRPLLRSPEQGADTIVWLAAADEALRSSGAFWHDRRRRPTHLLPRTRETGAERALLWQRLCELTGWSDPPTGPDSATGTEES